MEWFFQSRYNLVCDLVTRSNTPQCTYCRRCGQSQIDAMKRAGLFSTEARHCHVVVNILPVLLNPPDAVESLGLAEVVCYERLSGFPIRTGGRRVAWS